MMAALGAEVVLVDQLPEGTPGQVSGGDLALVEQEAQRIVRARDAFRADQFRLPGSARAHRLHTGPELLRQSGGSIGAFCDFLGTASSFAGCAAALKAYNPAIRCYVVEPDGAAILAGQRVEQPNHRIQGGGYAMRELPLFDPAHVDGYIQVTDHQAIDMARRLAREEGMFAGFSSGANVAAALHLLQSTCVGQDDRGAAERLRPQISEHRPVGVSIPLLEQRCATPVPEAELPGLADLTYNKVVPTNVLMRRRVAKLWTTHDSTRSPTRAALSVPRQGPQSRRRHGEGHRPRPLRRRSAAAGHAARPAGAQPVRPRHASCRSTQPPPGRCPVSWRC